MNYKCFQFHLASLVIFMLSACGGGKDLAKQEETLTDYQDSQTLMDVIDIAKEENKLVFLNLYTNWCLPCKVMEENVFSNPETADFINAHFIPYKVNAEQANGPDLSVLFGIESFPGLLFLDHRGSVLEQHVGGMSNSQFRAMADDAIATQSIGD